jgi:hypothetical protein
MQFFKGKPKTHPCMRGKPARMGHPPSSNQAFREPFFGTHVVVSLIRPITQGKRRRILRRYGEPRSADFARLAAGWMVGLML